MKRQKIYAALLIVSLVALTGLILFIYRVREASPENRNLTIVFYNVENLFDTQDDPGKDDDEFTPGGEKKWDEERYRKKLEDLAGVLGEINANDLPEIIGLGEVENRKVVTDLAGSGKLKDGNYRVVHRESPDERGIDCALMYRADEFKVIRQKALRIRIAGDPEYKTRDILYIKGRTTNREKFHIFVNHWPSRVEGLEKTEPYRLEVAGFLKSQIDSVMKRYPGDQVIVMGDMNDEPANRSLNEVLAAGNPGEDNHKLVNLMYPDDLRDLGSYFYRGNWNMLDNLIVSNGLMDAEGFRCVEGKGFIFRQEYMMFTNPSGISSPNRTYGGNNYYGGISDHLPVYFILKR